MYIYIDMSVFGFGAECNPCSIDRGIDLVRAGCRAFRRFPASCTLDLHEGQFRSRPRSARRKGSFNALFRIEVAQYGRGVALEADSMPLFLQLVVVHRIVVFGEQCRDPAAM